MREQPRALNVAKKLHPKAVAKVCAFNQSRHVGNNKALLVRFLANGYHAEIGLECGERVIGDLGPCGRDARDERGLAGVWIADQPHIGQQLEIETEGALLAVPAKFVLARGLVSAGGKVLVAAASAPAFGDDNALVRL